MMLGRARRFMSEVLAELRRPDDFANQPYVGSLNQAGHAAIAGPSLLAVLQLPLGVIPAVWVSGGLVVAWEAAQFLRRGAKASDMRADTLFWLAGIGAWASCLHAGYVTGPAQFLPLVGVAAFLIYYGGRAWTAR